MNKKIQGPKYNSRFVPTAGSHKMMELLCHCVCLSPQCPTERGLKTSANLWLGLSCMLLAGIKAPLHVLPEDTPVV